MNAHKFVAEHGIEEAKRVLEGVPDQCKIINISCGEYFEEPCECCKANEVLISELKQVVESVEIVERSGGFESVKAAITNYRASGDKVTFSSLEKRLADYELVESYKQVTCEVLEMVDVSPNCEVKNG